MSQAGTSKTTSASTEGEAAAKPELCDELLRRIEAALLTTDRPLPSAKLAEVVSDDSPTDGEDQTVGQVDGTAVRDAVSQLNELYEETGRSFRIERLAGGWQVMTLPRYANVLGRLHRTRAQSKLSPAALETLAIVAYKQPILRADVEAIRGVASGEVLRSLMERHLVKIAGRAEEIGRPILYGTTKSFLELFGLSSLKDLPTVEQLVQPRGAANASSGSTKSESLTSSTLADADADASQVANA